MSDLQQAVELLRYAVEVEGPVPEHHRKIMRKHRKQWPRLWQAIDAILAATPPDDR